MYRLGMRTIKSILAIVISSLFYVLMVAIDYNDHKVSFTKFLIPIIIALVAFFTISKDKKKICNQAIIFPLTILYCFILIGSYILISGNSWPSFSILDPLEILIPSLIICFGGLPLIYLLIIFKKKKFVVESMVLYLICLTIDFYELSYLYDMYSYFVSLVCGFAIGFIINNFKIIRHKNTNLLFFYGLDGFYMSDTSVFDDYVIYELNKLIEEDAKISFFSSRTPASLHEQLSKVHLNYPVITMNGAAIYNFTNNQFMHVTTIFSQTSHKIKNVLESNDYNYFTNIVIHNSHYIYINQLSNAAELAYSQNVKHRALSNFIYGPSPDNNVCFFLIINTKDKINYLDSLLKTCDFYDDIYVEKNTSFKVSNELKEYAYIKIYSRNIFDLDYLKRYSEEKIGISTSNTDALFLKEFDRVVTYDNGPKLIKNKANIIVNSKREHSLIRVIKRLYHKKSV